MVRTQRLTSLGSSSESEIVGVRIFSHGHLSRLPNPEYETVTTPEYLYTLTAAGLTRRRLLQELAKAESDQNVG